LGFNGIPSYETVEHFTPLIQTIGIDSHSLFEAKIHFLPSKSSSKRTHYFSLAFKDLEY